MGRYKGDFIIKTETELASLIRLIGSIELAMERNQNELNEGITRLKREILAKNKPLEDQRKLLMTQCQAFLSTHKEEILGKNKSKAYVFGKIGWRKAPDTVRLPARTSHEMADVVSSIHAEQGDGSGLFHDIQIRVQEWLPSAEAKKLTTDGLSRLGLKAVPGDDEFFVEPDHIKITEISDEASQREGDR